MTPNLLDELEKIVALSEKANAADIFDTFDAVDDFQAAAVNFLRTHAPALADMAKRMEAAERDAARYRWLRTNCVDRWQDATSGATRGCSFNFEGATHDVDADIDAAIDATQEGAG